MALATEKSIFLHIPKTGGMFVRNIFKILNIDHWEIGDQHSHFPRASESGRLLAYNGLEYYKRRYIFSFVRHPLSWYQSRWAFRIKHGWRPSMHPLDFNCASNDFLQFMSNVLAYKPSGWVTEEYSNYIDTIPWPINFVGKTENIVEDLITALSEAGEHFDAEKVRKAPRVNDSDLDGMPPKYWAPYSADLARKVLATDATVVSRYYYDQSDCLDKWCRLRPY